MRAKIINETKQLEWSQFGPKFVLNFLESNLPFLDKYNPEYLDMSGRGTGPENPGYSYDESYDKWDFVGLDVPGIPDGISMLIAQRDAEIGVKFYADAVSFAGNGNQSDEYTDEMDLIPIEEVDENYFNDTIDYIRDYYGF